MALVVALVSPASGQRSCSAGWRAVVDESRLLLLMLLLMLLAEVGDATG